MISRVADHCFWFGRYVERAESIARMLAATQNLALDAEIDPQHCWRPVIVVSGEEAELEGRFGDGSEPSTGDEGDRVQEFLTWDADSGVSITGAVRAARWNARAVRDVVSLEAWETINELHLWLGGPAARVEFRDHREAFYRRVRSLTQLTLGLLRSTMLHDEPLDFIWLGVLLERVSQTARMLDVHHHAFTALPNRHEVVETALWLSLMRALSGFEPFMKKNQGRVTSDAVARFLIGEDRFPRSIAYCVHSAHDRLKAIRPAEEPSLPGGLTLERLRVLDTWVGARGRGPEDGETVHELLTHVVDEVHAICDSLGKELLGYT
jgi:uncharacterized alpha-E superfamily protein